MVTNSANQVAQPDAGYRLRRLARCYEYKGTSMQTEEVTNFYYSFSRSEYALKASDFILDQGEAVPHWDRFANDIKDKFNKDKSIELKESVEYILQNPPKKQIVKDGVLYWEQTNNQNLPLTNFLLIMIRRIRNNLFHGGKLQSGYTSDVARDVKLINSATQILAEMITLNDAVKHYYNQPIAEPE